MMSEPEVYVQRLLKITFIYFKTIPYVIMRLNVCHCQGRRWYDPRDGGGRVESGTETESRVWNEGREHGKHGILMVCSAFLSVFSALASSVTAPGVTLSPMSL